MTSDSAHLPHPQPASADGDFVTYVFVVTERPPSVRELAAVAGHEGGGPLRAVPAAQGLSLVVQDVPAAAFDEHALATRLNDPRELERCVLAHHRGVEASGLRGAVVPLPMATLYLSDGNAVEAVRRRAADLHTVLDRLRGRTEMAVKVHAAPPEPAAEDAGAQPGTTAASAAPGAATASAASTMSAASGAPSAPKTGRSYLSRASARQRESRDRHEIARAAAHTVDLVLRGHAVAATRHRAQSEQLTGRSAAQLLNAAYLVDDDHLRYFRSALDRLRTDERCAGVEIVASGPWIPYSFAALDAPFDRVETEVRV